MPIIHNPSSLEVEAEDILKIESNETLSQQKQESNYNNRLKKKKKTLDILIQCLPILDVRQKTLS